MTDREKIIKGLECCHVQRNEVPPLCEDCPYMNQTMGTCDALDELLGDALNLLKAQEPVEPIVDIDTWKCGNCGHALEHQELLGNNVLFHEQYKYCPECGKAVKW